MEAVTAKKVIFVSYRMEEYADSAGGAPLRRIHHIALVRRSRCIRGDIRFSSH